MLQEEEIINKKETEEANVLEVVKSHICWGWEGCSFNAVILEYLPSVLRVLTGGFASQLPWIPI